MTIMSQLAVIFGVCLVSEGISSLLPFQFPASVISMILLLLLSISDIGGDFIGNAIYVVYSGMVNLIF